MDQPGPQIEKEYMSVRKPGEDLNLEQPAEPDYWANVLDRLVAAVIYIGEHPAIAIALLALVVSMWSVWQARKTSHANIVSVFLEEYASKEMHNALDTLKDFEGTMAGRGLVENFIQFIEKNRNITKTDVDNAGLYLRTYGDRIEPSRRKVSHFYRRAWRLYKDGYINKKAFRIIAGTSGSDLFLTVAIPLTYATHLIRLCDKDPVKFRRDLPRFAWVAKFEKKSRDRKR